LNTTEDTYFKFLNSEKKNILFHSESRTTPDANFYSYDLSQFLVGDFPEEKEK